MKAKITLIFRDEMVDELKDMFGIEDYSKIPDVIKGLLASSIKAENDDSALDDLTVEMID